MNGDRALFDSNIIIYISKREIPLSLLDQFDEHYISIITYMEVLGYRFLEEKEKNFITEILDAFKLLYIDQKIADTVIDIRKQNRIKLPDAIIAATAMTENLHLISRNIVDYENLEIPIFNPFD